MSTPDPLATLRVVDLNAERMLVDIGSRAMICLAYALGYVSSTSGLRIIQPNDFHPFFGVTQQEATALYETVRDTFDRMWELHPDFEYDRLAREQPRMDLTSKGYLWKRQSESELPVFRPLKVTPYWLRAEVDLYAVEALQYAMWYLCHTYGPRVIKRNDFSRVLGLSFEEEIAFRDEVRETDLTMRRQQSKDESPPPAPPWE